VIIAGTLAVVGSAAVSANAAIVERVVAVVGDQAILLTDVQERALPFLVRIHQEVPVGAQRNAAISQLYRQVLERMVDEELQEKAATRAKLVVTSKEIDDSLARIAAQNGLSVEVLLREAEKSGLSEEDYRREIRRQVLEAKLMNVRLQGRIRVTEEDLSTEYRRIALDERRRLPFRAAWIVMPAPRNASPEAARDQQLAAERVAAEARAPGADFAALAQQHSVDAGTRGRGGELGELKPGGLPPAVDKVALSLKSGEVSAPVRLGDELIILKLVERSESQLPEFEEAKDELRNRVYMEKMNKARRSWLDGLRRTTHVDMRL
jgi:peptidyl-prolyl cis-trans isomerase SurA